MFSKKNVVELLVILTFSSIFFFMFPITIQPDSTDYIKYLNIFWGKAPLSSWDVVRGPSLPIILFLITSIFGNSLVGYQIGIYLFFLLYVFMIFVIVNHFNKDKWYDYLLKFVVYVLLVFNPIIYGYIRTVMTEFVAYPLLLLILYYDWKNIKSLKRLCIVNSIVIIFIWFLKQPLVIPVLFSYVLVLVFNFFDKVSYKKFLKNFACLLISMSLFFISIKGWTCFLKHNKVNYDNGRNNSYFLTSAVLEGNRSIRKNYEKESLTVEEINSISVLEDYEKAFLIGKIQNKQYDFDVYYIYNPHKNNQLEDVTIIYDNSNLSTIDLFKFWLKNTYRHFGVTVDGYAANYLATINFYQSVRNNYGWYDVVRNVGFNVGENEYAASFHLNSDNNFLWMREDIEENVKHLKKNINVSNNTKKAINAFDEIGKKSFTILYLLLPILLIVNFCFYFKNKNQNLLLSIILLSSTLVNILFLSFCGSIIDRYAYVMFPEIVLGIYIIFNNIELKKKNNDISETN